MQNRYNMLKMSLLPNKYKTIGWVILVIGTILGVILIADFDAIAINTKVFAAVYDPLFGERRYFSIIYTNITPTLVGIIFIIGALMVSFSKEKSEDEYIQSLRLTSLLWAFLVHYVLLLFAFVLIYEFTLLYVLLYNMFTFLIIFIVRFNYILYRNYKSLADEKHH